MIENFIRFCRKIIGTQQLIEIQDKVLQLEYAKYRDFLLRDERYTNSSRLAKFGFSVYSQFDEDGIIQELFQRIGSTNKIFVEVGVGNGLENNTLYLLAQGWKGLWLEGDPDFVHSINKNLKTYLDHGDLMVKQLFVTKDNIDENIASGISSFTKSDNGQPIEIDLLSIDIDGNDLAVLKNINGINPRMIIMEYNGKVPPPVKFSVQYDPNHRWNGDFYMGSSLQSLEDELANMGYLLVGCNLVGNNAFFVRKDLVNDAEFVGPFSSDYHYEPPRYQMLDQRVGHQTSFQTLKGYEK